MKRLRFLPLLALPVCFLLLSLSLHAGAVQQKEIEIAAAGNVQVNTAYLTMLDDRLRLGYSITNKSGETIQILVLALTTYNAKGAILSHHQWRFHSGLAAQARVQALLPVGFDIAPTDRVVLEVKGENDDATASGLGGDPPCAQSFCRECFQQARAACGREPLVSYRCQIGLACDCQFTCRGGGGGAAVKTFGDEL